NPANVGQVGLACKAERSVVDEKGHAAAAPVRGDIGAEYGDGDIHVSITIDIRHLGAARVRGAYEGTLSPAIPSRRQPDHSVVVKIAGQNIRSPILVQIGYVDVRNTRRGTGLYRRANRGRLKDEPRNRRIRGESGVGGAERQVVMEDIQILIAPGP